MNKLNKKTKVAIIVALVLSILMVFTFAKIINTNPLIVHAEDPTHNYILTATHNVTEEIEFEVEGINLVGLYNVNIDDYFDIVEEIELKYIQVGGLTYNQNFIQTIKFIEDTTAINVITVEEGRVVFTASNFNVDYQFFGFAPTNLGNFHDTNFIYDSEVGFGNNGYAVYYEFDSLTTTITDYSYYAPLINTLNFSVFSEIVTSNEVINIYITPTFTGQDITSLNMTLTSTPETFDFSPEDPVIEDPVIEDPVIEDPVIEEDSPVIFAGFTIPPFMVTIGNGIGSFFNNIGRWTKNAFNDSIDYIKNIDVKTALIITGGLVATVGALALSIAGLPFISVAAVVVGLATVLTLGYDKVIKPVIDFINTNIVTPLAETIGIGSGYIWVIIALGIGSLIVLVKRKLN